jgi:glutamine cyclotransferase
VGSEIERDAASAIIIKFGLRKVEIETGKVLKLRELPESLFGEGITIYIDRSIIYYRKILAESL